MTFFRGNDEPKKWKRRPALKKRRDATSTLRGRVTKITQMTGGTRWIRISGIAIMVFTAACQDRKQTAAGPSPNPTNVIETAENSTDKWLGQWNGPEGTYLLLSKSGHQYAVKIQSLDGPATYEGAAAGDRIEFKRDGKTESIRAGSGKETGMKWLLEKKDCESSNGGKDFAGSSVADVVVCSASMVVEHRRIL